MLTTCKIVKRTQPFTSSGLPLLYSRIPMLSAAAPVEIWEPPRNAECAPATQATRLGPRDTSAATKIKEKETKHYGKQEFSVQRTPPKKTRAKPTPLSRSFLRSVGEKARGGGVLSYPLDVHPGRPPPNSLRNLHRSKGERVQI